MIKIIATVKTNESIPQSMQPFFDVEKNENMIVFNTTFHVQNGIQREFVDFLKEKFIPKAMENELLSSPRLSRVFGKNEDDGYSFALEFTAANMETLEKWNSRCSNDVYALLMKDFAGKVSGFTTLLQIINV